MAKTPKIRFKGFTEEWKEKTLGEQLIEVNEKNDPKQTDFVISLTVKDGVIPYSEKGAVGNKAKEDHSQYKLAYPNTIVLNSMNILIGAIGICNYFGCVSPIYYVYKGSNDADLSFVYRFMSSKRFQKNLRKYGNGIMEIRLKVPTEDLLKRIIASPSIKEQRAISFYFDTLDKLILQREKEVEKLRVIKRVFLEKLIPNSNSLKPSLRFRGFEDEWKRTKLSEFLVEHPERNFNKEFDKEDVLSVSGDLGIVNQIELLGRSYAGSSVDNYHIVRNGNIVYTKSPLKEYPYGIVKVNRGLAGIVSTLYAVYDVKNKADGLFIEYYFTDIERINKYLKPIVRIGAKHDMKIGNDEVLQNYVTFPIKEEQQKIGKFIQSIDKVITLRTKYIEQLKHTRQALLEQMFVNE